MPSFELPALLVDAVASVAALDRPVLVNRDPGPDELAVPIDASVALELVDPGPDGIDRAATRVWVDGAPAFVGGGAPEVQPGFDGSDAGVVQTADTLRVVLHLSGRRRTKEQLAGRERRRAPGPEDLRDELG